MLHMLSENQSYLEFSIKMVRLVGMLHRTTKNVARAAHNASETRNNILRKLHDCIRHAGYDYATAAITRTVVGFVTLFCVQIEQHPWQEQPEL